MSHTDATHERGEPRLPGPRRTLYPPPPLSRGDGLQQLVVHLALRGAGAEAAARSAIARASSRRSCTSSLASSVHGGTSLGEEPPQRSSLGVGLGWG